MAKDIQSAGVGDLSAQRSAPNPRPVALLEDKRHIVHLKAGKTAGTLQDQETSVIARAVRVIGDRNEALRWMGTPVRALDFATPISLVATAKGRRAVLTVLGRLEHGVL